VSQPYKSSDNVRHNLVLSVFLVVNLWQGCLQINALTHTCYTGRSIAT